MIKVGQEVFRVYGKASIRGYVRSICDDTFICEFTDNDGNSFSQKSDINEIGSKVFVSEKDLIKKRGRDITELARPVEISTPYGMDFYGYPLKEGDYVIAMCERPLYNKVEGYVKRIYKTTRSGFENDVLMDVADKDGRISYTHISTNLFSTSERFETFNS